MSISDQISSHLTGVSLSVEQQAQKTENKTSTLAGASHLPSLGSIGTTVRTKASDLLQKVGDLNPTTRLGKAAKNALSFGLSLVKLPLRLAQTAVYAGATLYYGAKGTVTRNENDLNHAVVSLGLFNASLVHIPGRILTSLVGVFVDPFRSPDSERLPNLFRKHVEASFFNHTLEFGKEHTGLEKTNFALGGIVGGINEFSEKIGDLTRGILQDAKPKTENIPTALTEGEQAERNLLESVPDLQQLVQEEMNDNNGLQEHQNPLYETSAPKAANPVQKSPHKTLTELDNHMKDREMKVQEGHTLAKNMLKYTYKDLSEQQVRTMNDYANGYQSLINEYKQYQPKPGEEVEYKKGLTRLENERDRINNYGKANAKQA